MAGFIAGVVVGLSVAIVYYRFGSRVYFLGEQFVSKVDGDYDAAYAHIENYVKKTYNEVQSDADKFKGYL